MKAWPVGSDTDSASGSSKSSPSNSPHQTGRRTLKAAKSLDELVDGNNLNGGGEFKIIEIFWMLYDIDFCLNAINSVILDTFLNISV